MASDFPEELAGRLAQLNRRIEESQALQTELELQAAERREADRGLLPALECTPGKPGT